MIPPRAAAPPVQIPKIPTKYFRALWVTGPLYALYLLSIYVPGMESFEQVTYIFLGGGLPWSIVAFFATLHPGSGVKVYEVLLWAGCLHINVALVIGAVTD